MSRVYTVQFTATAVSAQQDLMEITAAAGKPCRILALYLSQSTEVGDAQEEGLSILVKHGQTTSGSGGAAHTPQPLCFTDAAAGFVAEVNNTTKASAGTIITQHPDCWNVRMPFVLIWPERQQIELIASRRLTVELATTPADVITMSGVLYVEEFG